MGLAIRFLLAPFSIRSSASAVGRSKHELVHGVLPSPGNLMHLSRLLHSAALHLCIVSRPMHVSCIKLNSFMTSRMAIVDFLDIHPPRELLYLPPYDKPLLDAVHFGQPFGDDTSQETAAIQVSRVLSFLGRCLAGAIGMGSQC